MTQSKLVIEQRKEIKPVNPHYGENRDWSNCHFNQEFHYLITLLHQAWCLSPAKPDWLFSMDNDYSGWWSGFSRAKLMRLWRLISPVITVHKEMLNTKGNDHNNVKCNGSEPRWQTNLNTWYYFHAPSNTNYKQTPSGVLFQRSWPINS